MTPDCPTPKVTLLNWTPLPMETVYSVWEASKTEDPLRTPQQIKDEVPSVDVQELFRAVILQRIPIGEHIHFIFMLENVSVSWREQAVRHRIGTNASPERVGVDIVMMDVIPDLADSSWWSQSMRIQNMGKFAKNGQYRLPQTIADHPDGSVAAAYHATMRYIEQAYNHLVESGIPMEDARELIPLGAQHRISWDLNIGSLQHIVGKRGCWILQLGIWGPVITGMIEELANKVHPVFREMVTPPCLKGDKFTGCVYMEECRRRYTGDDKLPPCPLHLTHHHTPEIAAQPGFDMRVFEDFKMFEDSIPMKSEMVKRAEDYKQFWGRDPYTGKRLNVIES